MKSRLGITFIALVTLMIYFGAWYSLWNNKLVKFSQLKTLFLSRISIHISPTVSPTPLYIRLHGKQGRLGNHLYQYASLLGIARRYNRTPIWARGDIELEDIFKIKMLIDKNNIISKSNDSKFVMSPDEKYPPCYLNWTESLPNQTLPNRNVSMAGYFQNRLYFNNVERELRTHFTFTDSIINQARSILNDATRNLWNYSSIERNNKTYVAIHVRRGDYIDQRIINEGWVQPNASYYQHSMEYFNTRYSNVAFLLFSEDIQWCRKNILATNLVYIEGNSRAIDLAVASLCDHAVVTIGSFGQWIAWFINGVTVRPRNLPTPGSKEFKRMIDCGNCDYYFPKNAVLL